jgi:hypothetical protein
MVSHGYAPYQNNCLTTEQMFCIMVAQVEGAAYIFCTHQEKHAR